MGEGSGRLVVFDCDGVLIDSERLNVDIDVAAIRELGWQITREQVIDRHLGRSEADGLADIAAHIGRPVPQEWIERWRQAYRDVYVTDLVAVPGIVAALDTVVAQGYAVCVASSARQAALRRNLGQCDLLRYFPEGTIFSAQDVERGKPAPDLFRHAARSMGFDPSACVVVEDSQHGVAAARAAAMPVVGFAGGVTPRALLAAADAVIADPAELPAVIAGLWS